MKTLFDALGGIRRRLLPVSLFLCFILLISNRGFGQLSTASVNGFVRDSSGARLPNATVVLRNVSTSVENHTVSNTAGEYAFSNITPGRYTLQASAPGFSQAQVPAFTLTVSHIATIDFSLKVGSQNVVVAVRGATPQLNVSSAGLGTVIAARQVNDLPLNGRNFTQLLSLTPGVSTVNTSQNASGGYSSTAYGSSYIIPVVNGQTSRSNYFMIDGLYDNEAIYNTYDVPPIVDAIQEFKVVSHTDSAEYGSVVGGVINVVTKSGTNQYHGSAWEYARNGIFNARTYFLPVTSAKPSFSQNQFGGSGGGPVRIPKLYNGKDRTFFFGAYQGLRYSQAGSTLLKVPTDAEYAGDESSWPTQIYDPFSTVPNPAHPGEYIRTPFLDNQIPTSEINQGMIALAKFMLPPAGPVLDSSGDNAINTVPTTQTQNEYTIRIDQKIGANDSAFFRYSAINSTKSTTTGLPIIAYNISGPARNWGGSYVHVFKSGLVLQGQFGRSIQGYTSTSLSKVSTADVFAASGLAPAFAGEFTAAGGRTLLPGPGITGYSSGGEDYESYPKTSDSYEEAVNLTKVVGTHLLKFGGGFVSLAYALNDAYDNFTFSSQQTADTDPTDTINTGDPLASFVLGVPNNANRRDTISAERTGGVMSIYGQDEWKATDRLTLNLGLRYDVTFIPPFGLPSSAGQPGGIDTGDMDFTNGTYILQKLPPSCNVAGKAPCIPGDGTLPANVVVDPRGKIAYNSYDNVGPRLGFAYRIGEKNVVRGAFGIVYDNYAATIEQAQTIGGSWPDVATQSGSNLNQPTPTSPTPTALAQAPFGTSNALPAATPFSQVGQFFDPHKQNPKSKQWNLGVERLLSQTTSVTVNYVGSANTRLPVGSYYNTALTPGPGVPQSRSLYTYIAPTNWQRSAGSSSYNALQLSLDRRFTNGLSYQVAYTWAKSINIGGDGWFGVEGQNCQDPYNLDAYGCRGVAGNDLKHFLSANLIYEVPIGRGKRFSTKNGVLDYVLGNWQANSIFIAHSGTPFTITTSSDIANTGNQSGYETADLVGNPHIANRGPNGWFNTAAFATPPAYTYGNTGRNSQVGPAYWDLDESLFRLFPIGRGRSFEFRVEAFNVLNNVDLSNPNASLNSGTAFGKITGTANTARQLQLALKFLF